MSNWKPLRQRIGNRAALIVHIICGLFCVALYLLYPILAIALGCWFLVYEIVQAWKLGDEGWDDIQQFLGAAFVGAAVMAVLKLLGVI